DPGLGRGTLRPPLPDRPRARRTFLRSPSVPQKDATLSSTRTLQAAAALVGLLRALSRALTEQSAERRGQASRRRRLLDDDLFLAVLDLVDVVFGIPVGRAPRNDERRVTKRIFQCERRKVGGRRFRPERVRRIGAKADVRDQVTRRHDREKSID